MPWFNLDHYNDNGPYQEFVDLESLLEDKERGPRAMDALFDLLIDKGIITIEECNKALSGVLKGPHD